METICIHEVPAGNPTERLRTYAQKIFSPYFLSNKSIKKALEKGLVQINGQVSSTATMIHPGDIIKLLQEESESPFVYPIPLEIVFEDDHCAIIVKPSGISVHNHYKKNIINALPFNLNNSSLADKLFRPMPIHRLDNLTSGLLIIAKTHSFQVIAGRMLEENQIKKQYTAILTGKLVGEGRFTMAIEGKESVTDYKTLAHKPHPSLQWISLVHLYPQTGRTHQLRIHCANAGHPILGERQYARDIPNLKGKGLFLCATKLTLDHPITGEPILIEINTPPKFNKYF